MRITYNNIIYILTITFVNFAVTFRSLQSYLLNFAVTLTNMSCTKKTCTIHCTAIVKRVGVTGTRRLSDKLIN